MPEVMVELTQADLDTQLKSTGDQAIQKYKDELIEKGFNPDNIEKDFKDAQKQPQTVIGTVKEAKSYPLGFLAYATAEAKMNRMTVPEVIQKHIKFTDDDREAKKALNVMHKTFKSNDGEKLEVFMQELKTIGMANMISDGLGSDGGYDLEIAELLKPESVLFNITEAKQRTLVNGSWTKRVKTSGMTGYWLGETEGATDTKSGFKEITLRAKRAGALTTISKIALNLSNKDLQREAQEDLLEALGETVDTAFFTGSGTIHQPLGLDNRTGFVTQAATSSATISQINQDLGNLRSKMVRALNRIQAPYWIGTETQKIQYALKETANGVPANFAKDLDSKGLLSGYRFLNSNYVSTDDSVLWLIDAKKLIIASGFGAMLDLDENYDFAGGKIGIKAEIALDWEFERDAAVGKLTSATNHL